MSSGADALYVDAQAGADPNPPIDRSFHFLTVPQPTALPSLVVTGRFLGGPVPSSMSQSTLGMPRPRHSRGGMHSVPPC
jgi:hypothetical protein